MFDLLAPIFAGVGAVAAAIPIVLHMLRRTPSQRVPFSLVRFLRPSLPKLTRRSTIEHWPLMLLRILALILIALAFGRPFQRLAVPQSESVGERDRVVLLLDSSASMRREGIREAVLKEVQQVVNGLRDSDLLSIMTFSQAPKTVVSAEEWRRTEPAARSALLDSALDAYEPDWMGTRTGAALLFAADEVVQEDVGSLPFNNRRIVLITDFQRGSSLDELQTAVWPGSVQVDLRVVQPTIAGNAGISLIEPDREGRLRVRVSSAVDSLHTDFALQPFSAQGTPIGQPIAAPVAAGQRRSFVIPAGADIPAADTADKSPTGPGPTNSVVAGVELKNDPHPFDNVADLPPIDNPVMRVAHVGSTDANNAQVMRYYLQRVIDGNDAEPMELTDLVKPGGVVVPVAEEVRMVIVTDVVPAGLLVSLQSCVDRGGRILVAGGTPEILSSIAALLPENLTASEATVRDYAMFGQIDFQNPMFASFADARFSDFSSIRFWKYRRLSFDAKSEALKTVAKFDSGDAAIVEFVAPSGGRMIVLAAGWHPDDSQWALSTRFAPMITSLVRQAHPRSAGQILQSVGDRIQPALIVGADDWSLTLPDDSMVNPGDNAKSSPDSHPLDTARNDFADAGTTVLSDSPNELPIAESVLLTQPGRYTLKGTFPDGRDPKILTLLVGLPPAESRTDPLPVGQLQALGLSADVTAPTMTKLKPMDESALSQLNASELESRQKFWRPLLLAGMGCLLLESLIAGGIERRQRVESAL